MLENPYKLFDNKQINHDKEEAKEEKKNTPLFGGIVGGGLFGVKTN